MPLMMSPRYDGSSTPLSFFHVGRTRLGELTSNTANLNNRLGGTKRQYNGHLQKDAEEVADIVRAMLEEAFGAIAALQQKCLAFGKTSASWFFSLRASPANTSGG
ncbi:hypothetical protein Ddc_21588 [Ditylenchus destructor]|nr:hypothetical protein Ddc_21588 [Ditylenchus destructor]